MLRLVDARKRRELSVTLLLGGGASRGDAETALRALLETHWPQAAATA